MHARIVYMGTPDFAVAPLKALHEAGYPIACVVTVPDKPAGRGLKLHASPVKEYALANALPLLQPENLKEETFLHALRAFESEIGVVVAFRKLPKAVYSIPRLGFFNLHASLLPQYRGAAPINWAIINGEKESGVSTFLLSDTIDAGALLLQATCQITSDMTAGELHDKLALLGAPLVLETVKGLEQGTLHPTAQVDSAISRTAPKIFREDCKVDWTQRAPTVHNFIRGLSPYPGAWATIRIGAKQEDVKLFDSFVFEPQSATTASVEGNIMIHPDRNSFVVTTGQGTCLHIASIQPAGKRRMSVHDYLLGIKTEELCFLS